MFGIQKFLENRANRSDEHTREMNRFLFTHVFNAIPTHVYSVVNGEEREHYDDTDRRQMLRTAHICAHAGDLLSRLPADHYLTHNLYIMVVDNHPDIESWAHTRHPSAVKLEHLYLIFDSILGEFYGRRPTKVPAFKL